jgi:hypothetical protein
MLRVSTRRAPAGSDCRHHDGLGGGPGAAGRAQAAAPTQARRVTQGTGNSLALSHESLSGRLTRRATVPSDTSDLPVNSDGWRRPAAGRGPDTALAV